MLVISMAKRSCTRLHANGMPIARNSLVSFPLLDFPQQKILVEVGGDIHLADFYGRTPLHVAAASDHHDMVAFLIANGANVNAVTVHDAKHLATMDAKVDLNPQNTHLHHNFSYQIKIKHHYISQQQPTQRNRVLFC